MGSFSWELIIWKSRDLSLKMLLLKVTNVGWVGQWTYHVDILRMSMCSRWSMKLLPYEEFWVYLAKSKLNVFLEQNVWKVFLEYPIFVNHKGNIPHFFFKVKQDKNHQKQPETFQFVCFAWKLLPLDTGVEKYKHIQAVQCFSTYSFIKLFHVHIFFDEHSSSIFQN